MCRTFIVDDEEDMRVLLRATIDTENRGLKVVGEAGSGPGAIALAPELEFDVMVLDHKMPGMSGLDTAARFLEAEPDLPIVLYSAFLDEDVAGEADRIGIRHCVRKGDTGALVQALRDACAS
jgi:YesN/AraC family two-component response regulator